MNNKLEVIGIDHGWSMMKTVTQVFVTGVKEITTTPAFFGDVLEYDGKYYKIGTVRQEVKDTKVEDDSFYLLTLAAVAKELKKRGLSDARVFLAVGLPLTRFGAERNNFIKYLTKNKRVDFRYENEAYHIEIDDVAVFPQCYAAVVDKIPTMAKKTLVVDIGSWTIDIMPVINKSPDESKCVTVPRGLITCMRSINEQCVRQLNGEVDETEIQNIMRYGRSDIDDEYFAIIKAEIEDFVEKVYNSIREFGYNLKTTRRHIMESTFRLNLLNPQHAKINEVIKGLNPKIYKSKNQFLIEACEFYIDHYGEDDIPSKEEKRYEQFVTRDEIEQIKKEIEYSAMTEARKEVISLLGGALAGVKNSQPVMVASPQEDMEEQPEDDVMNDADVAGLAMGWMSKGD